MFFLASAPAQRAHESAVSLMLNPTVSVDDAAPFSWGLGLGLEKIGDDLFFFHRGNSPGFQVLCASRPAKLAAAIVIFTNSGNGLDAVPDIVAATHRRKSSHPEIHISCTPNKRLGSSPEFGSSIRIHPGKHRFS